MCPSPIDGARPSECLPRAVSLQALLGDNVNDCDRGLCFYAFITPAIGVLVMNNNNLVQTFPLLRHSEYLDSNYLSYFNIYGINHTL